MLPRCRPAPAKCVACLCLCSRSPLDRSRRRLSGRAYARTRPPLPLHLRSRRCHPMAAIGRLFPGRIHAPGSTTVSVARRHLRPAHGLPSSSPVAGAPPLVAGLCPTPLSSSLPHRSSMTLVAATTLAPGRPDAHADVLPAWFAPTFVAGAAVAPTALQPQAAPATTHRHLAPSSPTCTTTHWLCRPSHLAPPPQALP